MFHFHYYICRFQLYFAINLHLSFSQSVCKLFHILTISSKTTWSNVTKLCMYYVSEVLIHLVPAQNIDTIGKSCFCLTEVLYKNTSFLLVPAQNIVTICKFWFCLTEVLYKNTSFILVRAQNMASWVSIVSAWLRSCTTIPHSSCTKNKMLWS